ncbi:unnamed protein product [Amaranthus hypochondriacus]
MAKSPEKIVALVGEQLAKQTRLTKDFLVKSLRQAVSALLDLDQCASLKSSLRPLSQSLIKQGLLRHKDKDVRLLVSVCLCEIIRILAPKPPFNDKVFKDIFELFVSMFMELADTTSPYFSKRVEMLETIATLECCRQMLDLDCDDLILKMFNTFFSVVRKEHQQSLISNMLSIMSLILKEKEDIQPLMEVILQNLRNTREGPDPAFNLAIALIQNCAEPVEPAIRRCLISCISDGEEVASDGKECYLECIYEIFQRMPHMIHAVVPNLAQGLVSNQVDVRIKSVNLIGKLLALLQDKGIHEHHYLFVELLKRFSDKSAEVRINVIRAVKICYMANPSATESEKILSSLEGRLLDCDTSVRTEAISVVCDLAKFSLKNFPEVLITRAIDRLRDKMTSVRKEALKKLLEVYRVYCSKCHEGQMVLKEVYEHIPCKILMLSLSKNLKEFSPQNLELLLAVELFPASLPTDDKMRHWIYLYSIFTSAHVKALNVILCQKRRFQREMQNYLSLRLKAKGINTEDIDMKIKNAFTRMSAACLNPVKVEESFNKLNLVKDGDFLSRLSRLLEEPEPSNATTLRDKFLKDIGNKNPLFEFLELLSLKCSNNIFCSDDVRYILNNISGNRCRDNHQKESSFNLLLDIIKNFPKLLRGSEEQFKMLLLKEDSPCCEKLLQILANAGPFINIEISEIYPLLKRLCLEGTRAESKTAISVIYALLGSSEHFIWLELGKKLLESLYSGRNLPTVIQSLGCIFQHSVVAFQKKENEVFSYIKERIFEDYLYEDAVVEDEKSGSQISLNCQLKIYGLKTLVKIFIPKKLVPREVQIADLLNILSKVLLTSEFADTSATSCENDMAHLRLAAAKSVLRLSRRWEMHISPHIFRSTIMMAKDSSSLARKSFLDKTLKLLKEHAVSSKFACAFALAASDSSKDMQDVSLKYLLEFIKDTRKAVQTCSASANEESMTNSPAYIMVFLLHVLAHAAGSLCVDSDNEESFAQFCRPLLVLLHVLVDSQFVDGDLDLANKNFLHLRSIFRAIRRAEDAEDPEKTPKLHMLAEIGLSVLNALKHDNINLSNAPGLVLLPSSLYKTCEMRRSNKDNCFPAEVVVNESFLKKLVHILKCDLIQLSSSNVKHGRKCLKYNLQVQKVADSSFPIQEAAPKIVKTDKGASGKEMPLPCVLEACAKGKEQNTALRSSLGALQLQHVSPVIEEVVVDDFEKIACSKKHHIEELVEDGFENISTAQAKGRHLDSESGVLELFDIESDISTQELDFSLVITQKENRKHKSSSEVTECPGPCETNTRKGRNSDGSTDSFSQQRGSNKQCCSNFGKDVVSVSGDDVRTQGSRTNKRKVLVDRTNSLSENGSVKHRQPKKSCLGLKVSLDTSESEVSYENKDVIASRTRRRKT